MTYLKYTCFILTLLLSIQAFSQSECKENIDKANKLYEEGVFREAAKVVKKILETCELDKVQENDMLKLMASIYYEMDEIELADEYVAEFVKKNPHYIPSKKNDPYQFQLAYKNVKSWARFSLGLRLGAGLGTVTTKKIYPIHNGADYAKDYIIKPGFMGAIEFGWNITDMFSVNLGAGIRQQTIIHQVPQYEQLYFNYEEKSFNANVPLFFSFKLPLHSSFKPIIYLGGEMAFYGGGSYSYYYTGDVGLSNDLSFYLNRTSENVTINEDERNPYRYAVLGGVRLMYQLERLSIFADFRYVKDLSLYNDPDQHYGDPDLYLSNNYTLADIELQSMDISLGIFYNFSYKAKSKY